MVKWVCILIFLPWSISKCAGSHNADNFLIRYLRFFVCFSISKYGLIFTRPCHNCYSQITNEYNFVSVFPNAGSHLPGSLSDRLRCLRPFRSLCQVNRISNFSLRHLKHILWVKFLWDIWPSLCQVNQVFIQKTLLKFRTHLLDQKSKRNLKHTPDL